MRKMKKGTRANTEPVTPTAAAEEAAATVAAPAEEPVVFPVAEDAAPAPEVPVAEPEKKPTRRGRKPKPEAAAAEKAPKRGRKPKTEAAEKAPKSIRKPKVEEEEKSAVSPLRRSKVDIPAALGLYVQYQGGEVDMAAIAETAKAEFKAANKRGRIASLKIYLKPEEHAAYYVINDDFQGQVAF